MADDAERSLRDEPLNPAQLEVIGLLGAKRSEHPHFDPDIGTRLRVELEAALWPLVEQLTDDDLWVTKHALSSVHGCEVRHVADEEFAWSTPLARGSIVHKAVELSIHWPAEPLPLELVDEALGSLTAQSDGLAVWLQGLGDRETAELRALAAEQVTQFLECFPRLSRRWVPVTESRVRVELCDGRLVLAGKIDLSLGQAHGNQAGKVIIDLKTGGFAPAHIDDLRFYALVETMRIGTPPRLLASYYLDQARAHPEVVTEGLLTSALERTVDGATRLFELAHTDAEPILRTGASCRWCHLLDGCDQGQAHVSDLT